MPAILFRDIWEKQQRDWLSARILAGSINKKLELAFLECLKLSSEDKERKFDCIVDLKTQRVSVWVAWKLFKDVVLVNTQKLWLEVAISKGTMTWHKEWISHIFSCIYTKQNASHSS